MQGMEACLTYEGPLCDVFNLGESQTTTLSELIASIENTLGRQAIINRLPEQPGDVPLTFADISQGACGSQVSTADEDRRRHSEIRRLVSGAAAIGRVIA